MKRKTMLAALAVFVMTTAQAETWSYQDCLNYARQHNISLQKSKLNEQSSDYDLEAAQAQWQPTLDFATSQNYTNTPWANGSNKNVYASSYGLNAGWTVWDGGVRQNDIKSAKLKQSIDALATEDISRTLETDLLQVYINILYAKENIEIYKEAVALSEKQTERAKALMESGRLSKVDYAQLKAQLEQDNYALVNAQGTYDSRRMELKKLLELGISDDITLEDVNWTADEVLALLPTMESTYELAVGNDVQLQSLDLEKEDAEIAIKTAKAGKLPKISLNAGIGTSYISGGQSFASQIKHGVNENIGLSLSIPLLDNKKTKVAVAKANINSLNADLDKISRETELAQSVESWYIDARAAQARFAAAEEQVNAASISNDYVNEQFNVGLAVTVELMNAHNTLLEAKHSQLQAKYMAMLGKKMIGYYRTTKVDM
jgi:outer membrane protein